ncbi:MAG: branched-chain amino acid transporter permease [Bacilli bacterium]|nr:branched-chain amino acid transporter permease [Bacilli bacterium]
MKHIFKLKEVPIILFTIIVFLLFSMLSPNFRSMDNFSHILIQTTVYGIVAIGMTMVILIGGMDLSVGSILALTGVVGAMLVNTGMNVSLVILITIVLGAFIGFLNGLIMTKLNIPDIIATLAMMNILRGIAVVISGSQWITNFPKSFNFLGQGKLGGIPFPVILFLILALLTAFLLKKTPLGRQIYAVGGNRGAAALAGINVNRIRVMVYSMNGAFVGLAGIILTSMIGNIQASNAALNLQFQAMGSVLVGGANIFGGVGSILGTFFGSFLMSMIKNGLVLVKLSEYWVDAITGLIIIIALVMNVMKRKKTRKG